MGKADPGTAIYLDRMERFRSGAGRDEEFPLAISP